MKARGVVTDGFGQMRVESFEIDDPHDAEVLVKIEASGVCHTDLDHASWKKPLILGHEGAGIVAACGDKVTGVEPGDRVLLNWAIPCGACFQCSRGAENLCENKPRVPSERFTHRFAGLRPMFELGTLAEFALVRQQAVIKIPDSLSFSVAAIMGCAVMTGYGSVINVAEVKSGESVAIIGCGGVGLSVLLAAVLAGASPIFAIDVAEQKLAQARLLGATDTLLARRDDEGLLEAAAQVLAKTGGRGADYAFECTAVPQLGMAPLAMVRSGGTAVGVSGIEQIIPANMELFEFDKWYINPLYGGCKPGRDFPRLIDCYQQGQLPLEKLIGQTYSLEHAGLAFEALRTGGSGKSVVTF